MEKCTCGKTKFINEDFANQYIGKHQSTKSKLNSMKLRAYLCSICNTWHLTKSPTKEKRNELKNTILIQKRRLEERGKQISSLETKISKLKTDNREYISELYKLRGELSLLKLQQDEKTKTLSLQNTSKGFKLLSKIKNLSLLKSLSNGFKSKN